MSHPSQILKNSRLEGLTDGVFAIAMTILVLDLRLPYGVSTADLMHALIPDIFLKLFVFAASFVILGTLWVSMIFQLGLVERVNRYYLWANILYLMAISIVPFSATLVAGYPEQTFCIAFYAVNLIFASLCQFLICECAHRFDLNKDSCTREIRGAIIKRIFVAPIFYTAALLLSFVSPKIAFLLLIVPTLLYIFPGKIDKYDQ